VPELSFDPSGLEAIVLDLDGTLYRQDSLRRAMAARLVLAHVTRPAAGVRTLRVLGAYRKAQEELRHALPTDGAVADLAEAQLALACARTRSDRAFAGACVARWMEQEPLDLLASRIQPGLLEFLGTCHAHGLKLGVLSDYPAEPKLKALGLDGLFDVVLAAQSPDVGVFKPHPRGLLVAMERLGVAASACLYVGDRVDVDAATAAAAGVACCILTRSKAVEDSTTWTRITDFAELGRLLFGVGPLAQPILDLH
jgi:HAD superfamily hydrolase (TIGR01509 family)